MRDFMWIVALSISVGMGAWALHRESLKDTRWAAMLMAGCTISAMIGGMLYLQTLQRWLG